MKQQATFSQLVGVTDMGDRGITAILGNVEGHPKLGSERTVYTTRVIRLDYDQEGIVTVVETKNTIYTRR